jgi:hypothetical protein
VRPRPIPTYLVTAVRRNRRERLRAKRLTRYLDFYSASIVAEAQRRALHRIFGVAP